MIKGIIFDLDGTLLDTTKDITNSLNKALETFGFSKLTIDEVKLNLGNGAYQLVKKSLPLNTNEILVMKVKEYYDVYYAKHNNILTAPYENIIVMLEQLKEKGYKLAITSNKYQEGVTLLNKNTFLGMIDVALGETKGIALKPDPQIVNLALDKLGLSEEEVLYVGDTEVDFKTAVNANIACVLVTWGFRTKEYLNTLGATYLIDNPLDLLKILI